MRDYAALCAQYEAGILSGTIPSNKLVRQAIERAQSDRARQNTPAFPFVWSQPKADKLCRFIELCPHIKGALAGQPIRLEPWQAWTLSQMHGWQGTGLRAGLRRFRQAYIEVARGNGKSCLSSALALFMAFADGEAGAEVYSAATTRDQAKIVWGDAKIMAGHPTFSAVRKKLGISVAAHAIVQEHSNSKFIALSSQGNSLDGLSVAFCVCDELHAHQTRDVYDVIITGAGKRLQSLVLSITTAGFNLSGIGHEQHEYAEKVVEGSIIDESFFCISYGIDPDDDWRDENIWRKANPNYGISVDPDSIKAECNAAIYAPAKQPNFLTKHCNVWVSGKSRWCDVEAWRKAQDSDLSIDDFTGQPCFIAVDLAYRDDLACTSLVFPHEKDGKTHYSIFNKYYLPEDTANDGRNASYKGWVLSNYIGTTEGNALDYQIIEDHIIECMSDFDVKKVGFDPWNARQIIQNLQKINVPVIELPQNVQNLSAPTKQIEALVKSGLVHTPVDPVLIWNCSNVEVRRDTNDNVKPRKAGDKIENKIDGYIAIVNAMALVMTDEPTDEGSVYETRGLLAFG